VSTLEQAPGAHGTVDVDGVTLWADVRSGSRSVVLAERELFVADLVALDTTVSPYEALQELTAALAPSAVRRAPQGPLGGQTTGTQAAVWLCSISRLAEEVVTVCRCQAEAFQSGVLLREQLQLLREVFPGCRWGRSG
jgi:hypothetical protein